MSLTDVIQTIGIAITAIVSIGIAIYSKRESAAAKIRAANADARAEQAVEIAQRAAQLLEGNAARDHERLERERIDREAPALLETWIVKAKMNNPGWSRTMPIPLTLSYTHPKIADEVELRAAQLAANHLEIINASTAPPKMGAAVTINVRNPQHAANR